MTDATPATDARQEFIRACNALILEVDYFLVEEVCKRGLAAINAERAAIEKERREAGIGVTVLIAERDAARARVKALEDAARALLVRWELFTGPERDGWGSFEDAYYDLAKHARAEWKALRAALTGGTDAG